MLMSTYLPTLLTWLQQYGYPMLWCCICIAAIGLPLPISLVLLAAGAFAALGDFNIFLLALVTITASTCGDSLGYLLGRRIGSPLFTRLTEQKHLHLVTPQRINRAHEYFKRRGGWAVFLSRFLFSGLGGIINILAGAERYPYRRFLLFDFFGEVLGALIPLLLGYIFGASWEAVGEIMGDISGFVVAVLLVIFLGVQLTKLLRNAYTAGQKTPQHVQALGGSTPRIPLLPQQEFLHQDASSEPPML